MPVGLEPSASRPTVRASFRAALRAPPRLPNYVRVVRSNVCYGCDCCGSLGRPVRAAPLPRLLEPSMRPAPQARPRTLLRTVTAAVALVLTAPLVVASSATAE